MLAWLFHWSPESLMALTAEDLAFWAERVEDVSRAMQSAKKGA